MHSIVFLSIWFIGLGSIWPSPEIIGSTVFIPHVIWIIPFVLMLLSIAVFPLCIPHWWEKNQHKLLVAVLLSMPVVYYLGSHHQIDHLKHSLVEYLQFVTLLGALYYISGGIILYGDIHGKPFINTLILLWGAVLANFVGTTGASMLLIRPILRANRHRPSIVYTVVFFIFIVSNVGGLLTPLGDPPLFLGFLRGVPFTWTLFSLWKVWLTTVGILLTVYFLLDKYCYEKELLANPALNLPSEKVYIGGKINFLFLAGVIIAVAKIATPWREITMLAMILCSMWSTPKNIHQYNQFTLNPILEVAALFIGIFMTMTPALMLLHTYGSQLGLDTSVKFFWAAGSLSSFLDNAPTYVTFFEAAKNVVLEGATQIAGVPEPFLIGISLGSVFMGANTYIGNGPNFMVKAIAEEAKVPMPSFFGYMMYSISILIPIFVFISWFFLA